MFGLSKKPYLSPKVRTIKVESAYNLCDYSGDATQVYGSEDASSWFDSKEENSGKDDNFLGW